MQKFTFSYLKKWRSPYVIVKMCIIIVGAVILVRGFMYYLDNQYNDMIESQKEAVYMVTGKFNSYFAGQMMALELAAANRNMKSLEPDLMQPQLDQLVDVLGLFGAAVYSSSGNYIVGTKNIIHGPVADYNNFKQALFTQKVISNRIELYGSRNEYISLRVPMYIDKENKAVLAAALPVTAIQELLEKENLSQTEYFIVIDNHGKAIYHPRMNDIRTKQSVFTEYK